MALKHPTTNIQYHDQNETTPPHSPLTNQTPFPIPKTHHHYHPSHVAATYKECLKNHAAAIGGHALDGCGEFMPQEPPSYKCAACGCHRNFHRREPTTPTTATTTATATTRTHFIDFHRPYQTSTSTSPSPPISPSPQPTNYSIGEHLLLSLRTAPDQTHTVATPGTPIAIKINARKRFRTKFTQHQKEKMFSFANKVGWKMQRCDDKMVIDFCNEIGIKRGVFKVWMHNNKNTLARREKDSPTTATTTATATTTTDNTAVAAALVCSDDTTHQDHGSSSSS